MSQLSPPPLAIYLHFPWCVSKCPYCDFNSHALKGELPQRSYLDVLLRDLQVQAERVRGRRIISMFLGGGTPSLFAPQAIARVLEGVRCHFDVAPDAEVTMEANPGTLERGRFTEYAAAGINRVSLGAQSFDEKMLRILGRIHSPAETVRAAEELHACGLANFNLDLMYALPGQDEAGALADIERALALAPAHLSHYQLTIEAGTLYAAHPPSVPGDDAAAGMLMRCHERVAAAGFERYEVSAYARPGRRCTHNLNYWEFGDYVGAGAGAHGKLTLQEGIFRTVALREPRRYLSADPRKLALTPIPSADLPFEFMLNALRLHDGFDAGLFSGRTGLSWSTVEPTLKRLAARGLVELQGGRCRPSERGLEFLNESLVEFVPEKAKSVRFSHLSTGS